MASFSPGRCHPFAAFPKGDGSLGGSTFPCHHGAAVAADDDDDDDDDGGGGGGDDGYCIIVLKYTKIILCMFIIGFLYSY